MGHRIARGQILSERRQKINVFNYYFYGESNEVLFIFNFIF